MASFIAMTATLLIICSTQDGHGVPLSDGLERPIMPQEPLIRTKRCSCSSWDDKECIYFCHLDIIWVNTPSKVLPYGLGGSAVRSRRSTSRCECGDAADKTCRSFCNNSTDKSEGLTSASSKPNRLLASFRSVVQSNMATSKGLQSVKSGSSGP